MIKLDSSFNPKYEAIINSNILLADWFGRHQSTIEYFGLTRAKTNLFINNSFADPALIVLEKMVNAMFTIFEQYSTDKLIGITEIAQEALTVIAEIYEIDTTYLLEKDKQSLAINFDLIENQESELLK